MSSCSFVLFLSLSAYAQESPAVEPPVEPAPLTPEELAEIEAALGADLSAAPPPAPPTAASPFPSAAGQGRGAVAMQSMNPDLSFIADFALAGFSSDAPLMSGGHDPQANGFNLQQLELAIGSAVDPYLRFDANIVFSQFGVEIEEVYGTTLGLPGRTQIRAGQFLTRFGRINNTHPHSWAFVDQSFAIGRVMGGEGNRGLGVEGSVLLPTPWFAELIVSETMANGEATARSFYGAKDLGVGSPLDLQTTASLKQFFPLGDDWSLLTGLSWAGGPNPSGRGNRSELYGGDLTLRYRPITRQSFTQVTLTTEWIHRRRQVANDVLLDLTSYTQLQWRFAQRWAWAGRYELGTPARAMSGAADVEDPLDPEWTDLRQRGAVNLTFWPTEFSRIRLQYDLDLPGWRPVPEHAVFLAFELVVGAHGAHAF
jgi:hypothetical protein